MDAAIQWLVYLGIERGRLEHADCVALGRSLGDDAELVTFCEALIEGGHWPDIDSLQGLVDEAWSKAQAGDPPDDPFGPWFEKPAGDDKPVAGKPIPLKRGAAKDAQGEGGGLPEIDAINDLAESQAGAYLRHLLLESRRLGASDLHLSAAARPFVRVNRALHYLTDTALDAATSKRINRSLMPEPVRSSFAETGDADYALALDSGDRFRVNTRVHKDGVAATYRIVPEAVHPLEDLGFDNAERLRQLLSYPNGLILVTGPVGSGKTATLAAMVDELNRTREDHLITVEAPIEFVQHSANCQVTQREVGPHTRSFKSALKGALRQDPDIIVIGEMRDLETIEMAISASETGHLVIGTLHTRDASNTLNRLLDVFPAAQQTQIRAMVSESLRGIVCQRLLPAVDGGLALAYELLVNNPAVGNLIRDNKPEGLTNTMETGAAEGMRLMVRSVLALWEQGRISAETARANIKNRSIRSGVTDAPAAEHEEIEAHA